MSKIKSILIVSFFFPPSTKVGGKRFSFLSEIFKKKYPELHILTVSEKNISPKDFSLPLPGAVHRTWMFPPVPKKQENLLKKFLQGLWIHYLCFVDPFSGWIIPAFLKGRKIIKKNKIDIIIATGPPFSAMVVGYLLSLMTGAKLVLDYRDPWSNQDGKFCKIIGKTIARCLEKRVAKEASALVFCTKIMKDNFVCNFGKYIKAPCYVISNGFHQRDTIQQLSLEKDKKNMVYAGNFYDQRKIGFLSKALMQLLEEGIITKENFCVHIFGKLNGEDRRIINEYGLQEIVKEQAQVPYEKIIRYLKAADLLLLISAPNVRYAIPLKFFDYLSVRKPILAVTAKGSAVADLMKDVDCGRLALINNEKSILNNLRSIILEEKKYTFAGAEKYVWEKIGSKYLEVIGRVRREN